MKPAASKALTEAWEAISREQDRADERQFRQNLESAFDKFNRSLMPGRRRPCALTFDEMRALRQFIRKHYNS